jgi:CheY-like chemotaxis protein
MKIVIVEDDVNKSSQLHEQVCQMFPSAQCEECRSYRSGLKRIVEERPSLVILDMSMPTFDVGPKDKGGRTRAFGGKDILEEMRRRRIVARVVVVTQFETFGEGAQKKTLNELQGELKAEFAELYVGTVYYHPAHSNWRLELDACLRTSIDFEGDT